MRANLVEKIRLATAEKTFRRLGPDQKRRKPGVQTRFRMAQALIAKDAQTSTAAPGDPVPPAINCLDAVVHAPIAGNHALLKVAEHHRSRVDLQLETVHPPSLQRHFQTSRSASVGQVAAGLGQAGLPKAHARADVIAPMAVGGFERATLEQRATDPALRRVPPAIDQWRSGT